MVNIERFRTCKEYTQRPQNTSHDWLLTLKMSEHLSSCLESHSPILHCLFRLTKVPLPIIAWRMGSPSVLLVASDHYLSSMIIIAPIIDSHWAATRSQL